ncbi:MAG: hypothetical protein WDA18_09700 [Candidatus Ratteibacteria bacterium]
MEEEVIAEEEVFEDFLEYEFCKVFTLALKEGKGEDRSWKRNARCKKQWARHFK